MNEDMYNYYSPYLQSNQARIDNDFSKWRLDPKEIMTNIRHALKNEVYEPSIKQWLSIDGSKPLMNDQGISVMLSMLSTTVNKSTMLSNLEENEVRSICRSLMIEVAKMMFYNYHEYEIRPENYEFIIEMIMNYIYISLMRAMDEGERIALYKSVHEQRTIMPAEPKKGNFMFFGNKNEE